MEDPDDVGKRPGPWTWILGTLLVLAIVWTVFTMIARTRGSTNDTLPHARVPAASMVALSRSAPAPSAARPCA